MNRQKNSRFVPAVGGVSLLVVFAALCLTVFALLSLATVRADGRLAEASANATENYYRADCAAQEILARLRTGELPDGVTVSNEVYSFGCPVSDTQVLTAEVRLANGEYTVLRWQTEYTGEWEVDENMHLWDGNLPNQN